MEDKIIYLESSCHETECVLRLTTCDLFDDGDVEVFVHHFLPRDKWWKRVRLAVKYLFNRFPPYGYFGETMLDKAQIERLVHFLEEVLEECGI